MGGNKTTAPCYVLVPFCIYNELQSNSLACQKDPAHGGSSPLVGALGIQRML